MHTMKTQLLFAGLALMSLLAGCSKNEGNTPGGPEAQTQISARATSRGNIDVGTKAPITTATLNGKQADVYTTISPLHTYVGDKTKMFTDAYVRGTMTFNDTRYVGYDAGAVGNVLLPTDGGVRYMYGFYPAGWARAKDAENTYERLSFTFDGSHDVMSSWTEGDDDVQVKFRDATLPERGEFAFKHLLMRCDVQVQAKDADGAKVWGSVKSVTLKDATINTVSTTANLGYEYAAGGGVVSFFDMEGTDANRTYTDNRFEQTAFADMQPVTLDLKNACYAIIAPVTVDADPLTPELLLQVVTLDKSDGTEVTTEVPVSLDRTNFTSPYSSRGYAVTIQLNFRAGTIKALASVEQWKNGGEQQEDIDPSITLPKIGQFRDNGVVYWVDASNSSKYKVFSLDQGKTMDWATTTAKINADYPDILLTTDGRKNVAAMKAYATAKGLDFEATFPAAYFCDSKGDGWYLPAEGELKALYTAYQVPDNKTAIDASLAGQSGAAAFPTSNNFWSSTEVKFTPTSAYAVSFSNGSSDYYGKGSNIRVRCVKDL
jgi:Protein of unknown function (DUF1566)